VDDFTIVSEHAHSLYDVFERKAELKTQTHYCPGCGHGITHKLIARAIDELGIQNRVIMVSPVGCSVFAYYYFDAGNVQAAHGRAAAVATGLKRTRPESIVVSYQGDGDLAAIGTAEIVHAANRGESITVFFLNNAIYGMTGGQVAPTTPIGAKSTTTPRGRTAQNEGYPIRVSELLSQLEAPVYIERVALGNAKQVMGAFKAVKKGLENQVKGLGFSLIEVLSPCPTIWKLDPVAAQTRVREELAQLFPLGVYRDRTKEVTPHAPLPAPPALSDVPAILDIEEGEPDCVRKAVTAPIDLRVRVAGFGGQGVLMLGEVLAEAGLLAGLEVSWLPSYGPEMRSGTSNCHVRVSDRPLDSPIVEKPNVLFAMNEPSLHKFLSTVEPGGWVLYNGDTVPEAVPSNVHLLTMSFTRMADELGDARAANIVMLGALLEATGALQGETVDLALQKIVKGARWLELDRRALELGRQAVHEGVCQ